MASERSVVQSLDRALSILDVLSFAEHDLELREVAASTGLPRTTAHRLLATLERRGYVARQSVTGRYHVALKMFRYLASGHQVQEVLARLAGRSGETANLGTLVGTDIMYLARADSPHALRWQLGIGSRVPVHCSAMGKAILACSEPEAVERLLPERLKVLTQNTIAERATLILELESVRHRGYALDNEEFMSGVRCIAAPVWEAPGQAAGAVSLAGPAFRWTIEAAMSQIPSLTAATWEISSLLDPRAPALEGAQ